MKTLINDIQNINNYIEWMINKLWHSYLYWSFIEDNNHIFYLIKYCLILMLKYHFFWRKKLC